MIIGSEKKKHKRFWSLLASGELEAIEKRYSQPLLFRAVRVETNDDGTSYEPKAMALF